MSVRDPLEGLIIIEHMGAIESLAEQRPQQETWNMLWNLGLVILLTPDAVSIRFRRSLLGSGAINLQCKTMGDFIFSVEWDGFPNGETWFSIPGQVARRAEVIDLFLQVNSALLPQP